MQKRQLLASPSIIEGSIPKALLSFFFPILFGSFFQQLYNTADAVIVGRFVGKEALAAAGSGTSVFINLLVGFFVGLSNGASVVISQYYGSKDLRKVHISIETSMMLSFIGGTIVAVTGILISEWAMRLIGTPEDILILAVIYLKIYFIGMVPMFVYNMGSCILRSRGDSRTPLIILIVSCFSNIVLDILFVAVFRWGIAGAAWATVLCLAISAVLTIFFLRRIPEKECRFHFHELRLFDKEIIKRMLYLGIPAGIQGSMYNISNIIIQSSINSLGTNVIAGNAAYGKIDSIFWMCVNSFGVAMTVFAGQNYGAGNYKRVKQGTWVCMGMCSVMTIACSIIYMLFGRTFLSLFTTDDEVLDAGMMILRTIAPTFITYISIEILSGTIRGCGVSIIPTLFITIGICVFRILWVIFIFPLRPDVQNIMSTYPFSWILTSTMFLLYYRFGHWLHETHV